LISGGVGKEENKPDNIIGSSVNPLYSRSEYVMLMCVFDEVRHDVIV
jgi:hypothetical protein